jgi:guanylate cyclase
VAAWGGTFVAMGHADLALWQAGYCVLTLALIALLVATRRYGLFAAPHLALVMAGPFALHWQLGGFAASGGAMLWCLLGPVVATMLFGAGRSIPWFAAMMALALAGYGRELHAPPRLLTDGEASLQFVFNTVGFTAFLFLSTRYFLSRIDAEKARSDRLLLNILPAPIAERLKRDEAVIADRFEGATVLFSDLVGFTTLSARLPPEEVVTMLDTIFSAFDAIADRFGLEKIKTIGDAYMLVGGLPTARPDHAVRVADAALAMRAWVEESARARGLDLAMRIGIHSGEVVAGVIGRRKFSYDLWGDTVNTASRMESHGAPGRIQVSAATHALLDGRYRFEERGTIEVKGKGAMLTYWLVGVPDAPDRPR